MKKYIFEVALALGLACSFILSALALEDQDRISEKLIRLHIIANSDSQEDQALKLKVRDDVLAQVTTLTKNCTDVAEAKSIISENLESLESIANKVIIESGFEYTAHAELSDVYFPTRIYDTFSLPAGDYNALRIHLGNSNGQNWWCVLFPPICVSAAEVETELEYSGMNDEQIKLITSEKAEYKLKFKFVEIVEKLTSKF